MSGLDRPLLKDQSPSLAADLKQLELKRLIGPRLQVFAEQGPYKAPADRHKFT
jgi:hypothetical protein